MEQKKRKFTLEEYAGISKGCSYIKGCSKMTETLKCVCDKDDGDGMKCFKCGSYTHKCIEKHNNRGNKFQCASCISKALDPIFAVKKVLVQSYFQTKSIFQFYNQINFEFSISSEELCHQVQIRGLKAGTTNLSWPMQGAFYLNDQKQAFYQFKPLMVNSSRKNRKEEYIIVPREKLRPGKNYIRFKIVVVRRGFTQKYQCEEKGVYFMSINSINIISKDALINETFLKRRMQKKLSLNLLSQSLSGVQVVKEKLLLTCPLTRNKIKIPVRGRYCKHFGCACLETVIKFHAQNRQWSCPFCDCRINEPFIDLFVYEILKDRNPGSTIYIQKDGSYQWIQTKQSIDLSDEESSSPQRQRRPQEKMDSLALRNDQQIEIIQPEVRHQNNQVQVRNQKEAKEILRPIEVVQIQDQQPVRNQQIQQAEISQMTRIIVDGGAEKEKKEISNKLLESIRLQIMKMAISKKEKERDNEILQKRANQEMKKKTNQEMKKTNQDMKNDGFEKRLRFNTSENQVLRTDEAKRGTDQAKRGADQAKKAKLKYILTDIPELRSKQQSRQLFKKQNMQCLISKEKTIAKFLKDHVDIKNLFSEALT